MEIRTVGVLGAGTMGNGIAHVFARSGFEVLLCDVQQGFLDRALETISKNLEREVAKNKISADERQAALRRIRPTTELASLKGCDFVVEAATEKFAKEKKIQGLVEVPQEVQGQLYAKAKTSTPLKYMAPQSTDLKATVEAHPNNLDFDLKD